MRRALAVCCASSAAALDSVSSRLLQRVRRVDAGGDAYQAARPNDGTQLHQDFVMSTGTYAPAADGGTVYSAAFRGQRDVVQRLVAAGADKD